VGERKKVFTAETQSTQRTKIKATENGRKIENPAELDKLD